MGGTTKFQPGGDLLLYDTAGPFVQFSTPYVTVEATADAQTDGNGGVTSPKCTLGAKAGLDGTAGLKVQMPLCGEDACGACRRQDQTCASGELGFKFLDSCSGDGYCEAGGLACWKNCLTNDCGPAQETACDDGKDNDNDEDTDCEDDDCSSKSVCDTCDKQMYYVDTDGDEYGAAEAGTACDPLMGLRPGHLPEHRSLRRQGQRL